MLEATDEFTSEADALDKVSPLIGWSSPEHDAARNEKLWPILAKARDCYAMAIRRIEQVLPLLG